MLPYIRLYRFTTLLVFILFCGCFQGFADDVTLAWNPSLSEDVVGYKIYYGNASRDYDVSMEIGNQTSYTVVDLSDGTYCFAVTAYDLEGNESSYSNEVTTAIGVVPGDTTPPVISSVASSSITTSRATISWATNEASTTQVEYGLTAAYGSTTILNTTLQTSHVQSLSGLTAGTTYHYRVRSMDETENLAVSGDRTFTTVSSTPSDTTPPVISLVASAGITETSATISWRTNEASTTQVEYGLTAGYGSTTTLNTARQMVHTQVLSGLTPGTVYHYRVRSMDANENLSVSGGRTFSTLEPADTTPPDIGSVTSADITENEAKISWTTDEASTTQVEYGQTAEYGSMTALNTTLQTAHTQTLSGLTDDTLYHYRVRARDAAGNLAVSGDYTFTTLPDRTPPVISSIVVSGQTGTEATITWTTNETSDTQVEFGTTTEYENLTGLDSSLQMFHSRVISGLSMGELYHFRVMSTDKAGNLATSDDYTFTTIPPASILTMPLFNSGQNARNETLYVGTALTNLDADPAALTFTAFDEEGDRITGDGITNPVVRELNPGGQITLVDVVLFGDALSQLNSKGWVRVESSSDQVRGFFLTFDGQTRLMDGAGFYSEPLRNFVFTDVEADGRTTINLINNNPENANVTIELVQANGQIRNSVIETIEAYGTMTANVYSDLFSGIDPNNGDYIRVSASQAVEPFQMLQQGTADISFITAQDTGEGASVLYSPQYIFDGTYRTSLSIVNLGSESGSVRIRLYGEDGEQIGKTEEMTLGPNGKLHIDDPEYFLTTDLIEEQITEVMQNGAGQLAGILFGDSDRETLTTYTPAIDGYIKIEGEGLRLVGSAMLRDRDRETFTSALPLVSRLNQSLVFSHVASDDLYFTGIALINPGTSNANVTLGLYTSEGEYVSHATLVIPAGQRECKPLTEVFSSLQGRNQTNGYVRMVSDTPVAAYSIFGTYDRSMLSAIPGQVDE